jgi:hypothetical protein
MKKIILVFYLGLFVIYGCEREKECNPNCGPFQKCDNGVCGCRDDQFLLGNSCIEKCTDCYEGVFDCGCTDKYIFNISQFDAIVGQITLHYVRTGVSPGIGYTDVTKLGEHIYRFTIPRYCDAGGKQSTNIEFTVNTKDSTKLEVTARYYILPSNETLETCSAIFLK